MGSRRFFAVVLALFTIALCGEVLGQESGVLIPECKIPDSILLSVERQHRYWRSANEQASLIADNGRGPKSAGEWWAERFSLEGFGQIAGERKWRRYEDGLEYGDKNHVAVKLVIPFNAVQQLRREASARRALTASSALAESKAKSEFYKKFIDLRAAIASAKGVEAEKHALDIAAASRDFRAACLTTQWQEVMGGEKE
jgi:hypothetical protein